MPQGEVIQADLGRVTPAGEDSPEASWLADLFLQMLEHWGGGGGVPFQGRKHGPFGRE